MKLRGWVIAALLLGAAGAQADERLTAASAASERAKLASVGDVIPHPGDLVAGAGTNRLGQAVAVYGDTAVLGAPFDDTLAGDAAGSVLVFRRVAGQWEQEATLVSIGTAANDHFGASVAIQGDTAIVGAPGHDSNGLIDAGAVYVFRRVGAAWEQRAILTAAMPSAYDHFGFSVSLDAATLVVGAYGAGVGGAVDSFVGADSAWVFEARLAPSAARSGDNFGAAVALHGDSVVVGASGRRADPDIRAAGAAFVFVRTDGAWAEQAELRAPAPTERDFFGNSVALHGDTALVGAYGYGSGLERGAAFAFRRNGTSWSTPTRLIAPGADADGQFGSSVALSGTRALVGAEWDSTADFLSGAAYVFADAGAEWVLLEALTASDALTSGEFGAAVALDGTTAVIGAPDAQRVSGSFAGAAYFFTESGNDWVQQDDVDGGDTASRDLFGYAMAVSGDTLVVGAPHQVLTTAPDVAAFVFVRDGADWVMQASLRSSPFVPVKHFGSAVAVDGDTIAIGTPWDDGAVYIFTRENGVWSHRAYITSPDRTQGMTGNFGASLALQDGTLLIGAPDQFLPGGAKGIAYVFTGQGATWTLQARLSDPAAHHGHGHSVALLGEVAVLGADGCFPAADDHALVFVRNGHQWTQEPSLRPDPSISCANFGSALAVSGDRLLVGAPYEDAAYLLRRGASGWTRLARMDGGGVAGVRYFGRSVALSGDAALVGASNDLFDSPDPGSAYVFSRSGEHWGLREAFGSPAGAKDEFGHRVAWAGTRILVGAPSARGYYSGHYEVGAVYEHGFNPPVFFGGFE
jgi:hypothetical protein